MDKQNNTEISKRKIRVFFMVPAPIGISPAQRFRFEHYLPLLEQRGIHFKISSFYSLSNWKQLYTSSSPVKKAFWVLKGFLKRFVDLFRVRGYHYVYIQREATPIGPPVIEFILKHLLGKRIIYDFDDAIWVPVGSAQNKLAFHLRWFSKVARICKWSYKISTGNDFLADYAKKYNKNTEVIPTVVDTETQHTGLRNQLQDELVIGWTGTFSTLKYLDMLVPAIRQLQERNSFTFLVIADRDPELPLKQYRFIKWNKHSEVQDLLQMHIGVMPLYDSELEKGKCGFKAIQYMSLGIPPVISPVGMNKILVDDGENGFLADGVEEWCTKLEILLKDPSLRASIGRNAREKIKQQYSVASTLDKFVQLFN